MKFILSIIIPALVLFGCGGEESEKQNITEENLYNIDTADIET